MRKNTLNRYAAAKAKTEQELQGPGLDRLIEQLTSACEHARKYKKHLLNKRKKRSGKSSKQLISAIEKLIVYLEQYPLRSRYQIGMAELQAEVKLRSTEALPPPRVNFAELLRRLLEAFGEQIAKDGGRLFDDTDPERPQIGNLLYPFPDDVWDNLDAKPKLPNSHPSPETMLAFELACRFRYWSLGRTPQMNGDFGGAEMPKKGRPHFLLVEKWVEAAFGTVEADLKKRVDKLVARSRPALRPWPALPSES